MYRILMPYTYVKNSEVAACIDGYELLMITAGVFHPGWDIDQKMVKFYGKVNPPCWTFHASHSTPPSKFKHLTMNLASKPSRETEKALRSHILAVSAIAEEKKPNILPLHSGSVKNVEEKNEGIENVIENIENVVGIAEEREVILALETKERRLKGDLYFIGSMYQDLLEIRKGVQSNYVKFTCDIGHLKTMGGITYVKEAIQELGKHIVHAHIHWNDSRVDLHQPLTVIGENEMEEFEKIVKLFMEKTSIPHQQYGTFTLEIPHKSVAGPPKYGSTVEEQIESIRILRRMVEAYRT